MSVLSTYRDAIYEAENTLESIRNRFLIKAGWIHTCQTPSAVWMWLKEIDGKLILTDTNTAIRMQDNLS